MATRFRFPNRNDGIPCLYQWPIQQKEFARGGMVTVGDVAKHTILIVEDDASVREMVAFVLVQAGFQVMEAVDAYQALAFLAKQAPALVLLDWMMPGMSGIRLVQQIKREPAFRNIPLIMLSARGEEHAKVLGLECGADDYITKPFSSRELVARIRAVLRGAARATGKGIVAVKGLRVDLGSCRVTADTQPLSLGPTEFNLLEFFITHRGRVYTRAQLRERVAQTNPDLKERAIDVYVHRLRQKLAPFGYDKLLETVHGGGYRFSASDRG